MSRVKVRKATQQEVVNFEVRKQQHQAEARMDMSRTWSTQHHTEQEAMHESILKTFKWSEQQYGRYDTSKQRLSKS